MSQLHVSIVPSLVLFQFDSLQKFTSGELTAFGCSMLRTFLSRISHLFYLRKLYIYTLR